MILSIQHACMYQSQTQKKIDKLTSLYYIISFPGIIDLLGSGLNKSFNFLVLSMAHLSRLIGL